MFRDYLFICYIFFTACMCWGAENNQVVDAYQNQLFSVIEILLRNNIVRIPHHNGIILSQVNKKFNALIKDDRKTKRALFKKDYLDNSQNPLYITDNEHHIEILPQSVIFDASGMYACGYSIRGTTKKDNKPLQQCYGYQIFTYPECCIVAKELTYAVPHYTKAHSNGALTLTIVEIPASDSNTQNARFGIAHTWSTIPSNQNHSQTTQTDMALPTSGKVNATLQESGNNLQCTTCYYQGDSFEGKQCRYKMPIRYTIYRENNQISYLWKNRGRNDE